MAHIVSISNIQRLNGHIEVTWQIDGQTRGHYFDAAVSLVEIARNFDLEDLLFFLLVAIWRARNGFNQNGDAVVQTLQMTVDLTSNTPIVIGPKV